MANISIEKALAPDLPRVFADPEQCHQVFLNLCMNAFQAMNRQGSLRVETRVRGKSYSAEKTAPLPSDFSPASASDSTENATPMVEVVITDTGEGIPPEKLSRIFDPFFSTKDDGVGLGLSLVHKIIENHNGQIRVSSKPGVGTTFIVSLPVVKTAES
jgi:signal transduction histidine kinase